MERKKIGYLVGLALLTVLAAALWIGVMRQVDVKGEALPQETALEMTWGKQLGVQAEEELLPPLQQMLYEPPLALADPLQEPEETLTAAEDGETGDALSQEPVQEDETPPQDETPTTQEPEAAETPSAEVETPAETVVEEPVAETATVSSGDPVGRMLELVNGHRAENGLAPLTLDSTLCSAASTRASEITRNFSHTRPDGSQWYTVTSLAHGENLVMGTGMNADEATRDLMNSAGHRANILDSRYATLGVGYCYSGSEGYWVQLFGY